MNKDIKRENGKIKINIYFAYQVIACKLKPKRPSLRNLVFSVRGNKDI